MTKEELKNRTKQFALDVFKFLMSLEKTKANDVVSFQLFKSSSSVAANYRAVCRGKSDADFLNKLKIVDEEADKSLFWLEFIKGLEVPCDKIVLDSLIKEANELTAIFAATDKTNKMKQKRM